MKLKKRIAAAWASCPRCASARCDQDSATIMRCQACGHRGRRVNFFQRVERVIANEAGCLHATRLAEEPDEDVWEGFYERALRA